VSDFSETRIVMTVFQKRLKY